MVNVVRLTFRLYNPHRNRWIRKMRFVKVKNDFLSDNIQNLLHGISFVVKLLLTYRPANHCDRLSHARCAHG